MTTPDAATSLKTFAHQFPGFHVAVVITAVVAGLIFVALGIYNLATLPQRQRQGGSAMLPAGQIMAGAALLSISHMANVQTHTIFGDGYARTALDFMAATDSVSEEGKLLVLVLLGVMAVFGWAAMVRGWIILANIGHQQQGGRGSQIWNAMIFLVCGSLSSNLIWCGDIVAATFGTENYLRVYLDS